VRSGRRGREILALIRRCVPAERWEEVRRYLCSGALKDALWRELAGSSSSGASAGGCAAPADLAIDWAAIVGEDADAARRRIGRDEP
jgi:hypothetical protein